MILSKCLEKYKTSRN